MKDFLKTFLLISFILIWLGKPNFSLGEVSTVVINEIAWMGTEASFNDEWIELYNNSESTLNLSGWKLTTKDGTPEINLKGGIPNKGFFLLERTDETTVPDVVANLIYKGVLNNEGKHLKLIDSEGKIIDEINCSAGWFAGDNESKRTMERINPQVPGNNSENWQNSQNPDGTPKAKNSLGQEIEGNKKFIDKKKTAAISETFSESSNPWFIFLVASAIAVFSGIIVFFLKRKIKKRNYDKIDNL